MRQLRRRGLKGWVLWKLKLVPLADYQQLKRDHNAELNTQYYEQRARTLSLKANIYAALGSE